jgi:hypothetical protein
LLFLLLENLLASVYERSIDAFALKKHEHSECIINAFDFAFALETTRAKRVP